MPPTDGPIRDKWPLPLTARVSSHLGRAGTGAAGSAAEASSQSAPARRMDRALARSPGADKPGHQPRADELAGTRPGQAQGRREHLVPGVVPEDHDALGAQRTILAGPNAHSESARRLVTRGQERRADGSASR